MSAAAPAPIATGAEISYRQPPAEACPLCGTPLQAEQEWCLRCGAAARTRLAAAPNWRAPLATIATIAALALGILAAALVKLAADSGPAPAPTTRTVTTPAALVPTTPGAGVPTTTFPGTTTPGTTTPGAVTPGTATPGAVTPGATTPGTTPGATTPGTTTPQTGAGALKNSARGKGRLKGRVPGTR